MIWNENEMPRIIAVQMVNLRGFLGIRRIDKFPNERIRELCEERKGVDRRIDEGVLRWFSHVCEENGKGQDCQDGLCRELCRQSISR